MTCNVAVLVSGNGTNLQALIDSEARGALVPASIRVVVSNVPDARALERARLAGIEALAIDHRDFGSRRDFEQAIVDELRHRDIELVVLAGFMRILTATFVEAFPERILNTHPALLPSFPGVDGPGQAIAYGAKVSGCTVHLVDLGVDTGPIIMQEPVVVLAEDDPNSLHDRIREQEHRLLPEAVQLLAAGRIQVEGRRVTIANG